MPEIWLFSLVLLLLMFTLVWAAQWKTSNAGYVDVAWSLATGVVGLTYLLTGQGEMAPRLAAGVLLLLWSSRLGSYIFSRVVGDDNEDGRYAAMRSRLGGAAQPVFLVFFWLQAGLVWCFSLPFWVIAGQLEFTPFLLALGVVVGLFSILGEAIADRQLARFKAHSENAGKTCRQGLWRYSRHPNYFFEWLHWFSYPLIAVGAVFASWLWLLPVAMFLFLWFVTGIPYSEKQALKSRGDDYRLYQRTTSPFIPWKPAS